MKGKQVGELRINPVQPPGYRSHMYTDLLEKTGNQLFDSFTVEWHRAAQSFQLQGTNL